jgi:hypothetical protein
MQFIRIVRWLEAASGLMAGVLGLFFVRYLFMAIRAPWFNPSEAFAPLSLVLVDFIFLIIGIAGAFLHGWSDRRVGRKLLWAGAIPLIVLTVLGIGPYIDVSLFFAGLLLLIAAALSMLESPLPSPRS